MRRRYVAAAQEFAELVELLKVCNRKDLGAYVCEIEKIFKNTKDCEPCTAKLCVYLAVICKEALPDKYREYTKKLEEIQKRSKRERDYREEVLSLIKKT